MPSRGASSDLLVLFCSSDLVLFFLFRELSSTRSLVGLFNDRVLCRRVIFVRVHTLWLSLFWSFDPCHLRVTPPSCVAVHVMCIILSFLCRATLGWVGLCGPLQLLVRWRWGSAS